MNREIPSCWSAKHFSAHFLVQLSTAFPIRWDDPCDPVNCREGQTLASFLPCYRRQRSSCFLSWIDSLACVLAVNIWLVPLQGK